MSERLVLSAGELELHLLPGTGGSIARFDYLGSRKRQPLLRGTDRDDPAPTETASFPLVPFANRIRGGSFRFRGTEVRLTPNMPPDPSPLHGQGWLLPWEVRTKGESKAELSCVHESGEWPWHYEARQDFALDPGGLSIELSCRNLSPEPMPCALGLHPYYPCDAATVLDTEVEIVWTVDEDVLPTARIPARGRYDLHRRSICGQSLDNGFGDWSGQALIEWGGGTASLRLSSPDARFFQVYSPGTGGFFVAEPVQNANCALNEPEAAWEALGIVVLAPGEERRQCTRFDVMAPDQRVAAT